MSAEREKFEAWKKNLPKLVDGADEIANESIQRAIELVAWIAWQARAEARPSVSGLPERPKRSKCEWVGRTLVSETFQTGEVYGYIGALELNIDAQSSRIVELEKELAETIEDVHAYVLAAKIQRERADEAESKLDVCREETIKECAAAVSFACGAKEKLLSKLPTSVAEKKS